MSILKALTPNQRNVVIATFLGWTLDAFDFFIIVFLFKDIAKEFNTDIPSVTATLFLTLAMRPLGAFIFGMAADRFGRRPTLMVNILFYSIVEFLSGFAPSLTVLVIPPRPVWYSNGRRMGRWGIAYDGNDPAENARDSLRNASGRLSKRLLVSCHPLRHILPFPRLAWNVHGRRLTGAARVLHPP